MNITFTASAHKFIARMLRFSPTPTGGFRLIVKTGGCSGLASEFSVEAEPQAGDQILSQDGLRLFLPVESRLFLDGATVDFAETLTESGFVIHQPNHASSCCSTTAAPELVSLGNFG
jgi:iron-sulfur cluster assembly accessory protein